MVYVGKVALFFLFNIFYKKACISERVNLTLLLLILILILWKRVEMI